MENLKSQARFEARQATLFSQKALEAARRRNYIQSGQFRQQAQEAGRRCRLLIEELQKQQF